eukprot:GEMP01101364.1.p1 GENE.GEMP01101364.1~~GEMP01101364.1.p1  ORF type:complete len:112 (+),score=22.04 GEMP01101364.1:45-380(+)
MFSFILAILALQGCLASDTEGGFHCSNLWLAERLRYCILLGHERARQPALSLRDIERLMPKKPEIVIDDAVPQFYYWKYPCTPSEWQCRQLPKMYAKLCPTLGCTEDSDPN